MRVLITAGGTREPIDTVRSITNHSTGRLGSLVAELFAQHGAAVTYVCGENACQPTVMPAESINVSDTASLFSVLEALLSAQTYDAVIHAMAVSDYTPHRVLPVEDGDISVADALCQAESGEIAPKINSGYENILLWLKQTPKVIEMVKRLQPRTVLVGFKLLSHASQAELLQAGCALLSNNACDFVLCNDLRDISGDAHTGFLIDSGGIVATARTKQEIARAIYNTISERVSGT
jgi:phosphopantothenate-cysteine ligase